uniref:Glycosyltransferase 2-like domain-containing protein n=1 Tax=Anopheles coluzzii TaxID=1518534 RepID=A0A8W7PW73_ANOCL
MLNSTSKHILHCALLFGLLIVFEIFCGGIKVTESAFVAIDPWEEYGTLLTIVLYLLRLLTFLTLPQVLFNFFGLVIYNAFPEKVVLKGSPLLAPFICIRIVTRGDYAELVKTNVLRNMNTCLDTGLENFLIEVVTDKPIGLPKHRRTREIVVPKEYKTKTGAMFKARALQYCLEDTVNVLNNNDWVVHLDEETLLTENSVRGIINFVLDGKHPFGQGLITYANENVVNWLTTLADSFRVHAEKAVSFDNGIDGSVAEDCFFAMRAFAQGYTFNFIEGEMYEKSPFTLTDFLQQRKRWLQGILLVVRSTEIPLRNKVLLGISLCSWITMPLSTSNMIFAAIYPIPCPNLIDFVCAFIAGFNIYMYVFGVIKSFSLYRFGLAKFLACVLGALCTIPINVVIENVAVIWGLVGKKNKFYVVQKDVRALVTV